MTMSHATKTRSVPSILPSHAAQIHVQPPSGTSDVDIYPLTNYTFGEGFRMYQGPLDTPGTRRFFLGPPPPMEVQKNF